MNKRGFTIIELLVVIAVITVLAGIISTAYVLYQNRSYDSQAKGLRGTIVNTAERYHSKNNEYPSVSVLRGSGSNTAVPTSTQYATMATKMDAPITTISGGQFKLFPCSGACTIPNTTDDFVYYLTKGTGSGSSVAYTINGCVFTFPSNEIDGTSYVVVYNKKESGTWEYTRSSNGEVTTSNPSLCPFR